MKKSVLYSIALACIVTFTLSSCNGNPPSEDKLFIQTEDQVKAIIGDGHLYTLNDFKEKFLTDTGNFCAQKLYRSRSKINNMDWLLFTIDTLPDDEQIFIRGRISTDDYGGNFYKSMVIQQIVEGKQQNLRISIDMGSVNGLYQIGQEVLIHCNGLSLGRYANQAQLCIPTYNNNTYANKAEEKVGWAPGRISAPVFRKACYLIGKPKQSELKYDNLDITKIIDVDYWRDKTRLRDYCIYEDGRLVEVKNVWFTGEYHKNGKFYACNTGTNPAEDGNANVFAPTTNNMGYPQSRAISCDAKGTALANVKYRALVSNSEYTKYAFFYLPASTYVGSIRGIFGFYADNGSDFANPKAILDKYAYNWSITPRGLRVGGEVVPGVNDIFWDTDWVPKEYGVKDQQSK